MSSRTSLTVVDQAGFPEEGPSPKTLENMDVTNGNKFVDDGRTVVAVRNSAVASRTVTYTYSERGQTRTKAVTLAASEECILGPFPPAMRAHDGDASENGSHVWLTASGSTGEVKARAVRFASGVFA